MLVLTRRVGETVVIGEDVAITVVAVKGAIVRIGVTAPASVRVDRHEVHQRRAEEMLRLTEEEFRLTRPLHRPGGAAAGRRVSGTHGGASSPAIADYTEAIRLAPHEVWAYYGRGQVYQLEGEDQAAIRDYTEAIRLNPEHARAYRNRGTAYYDQGENGRAIADYTAAIRLDPEDAWSHHSRGLAHAHQGDYPRAIADYTAALRLAPNDGAACFDLGCAYSRQGDYPRAVACYGEAVRLAPLCPGAYGRLAWLWASCLRAEVRDGEKAVDYALRACELSAWKEADHLGGLAAAYAECGRFPEAVQWAQQALDAAPEEQALKCSAQLEMYQADQPYREPER